MRLFICHNKRGEIISVTKANVLPEGLEHPYVDLDDETVLEVQPSAELEQLDAHEIAERFTVDVRAKRLKPRAEAQRPRRPQRHRGDT